MRHFRRTLGALATAVVLLAAGLPEVAAQPYAYIVNNNASQVTVLDTATNGIVTQIPMSPFPIDVAVDTTGSQVYVAGGKFLYTVLDAATNQIVAHQKSPGGPPWAVASHPSKPVLYITRPGNKRLMVADLVTRVVRGVEAGKEPYEVVVQPSGGLVYVSNSVGNTVSVLDTATNKVVATVNVPGPAYAIGIHPDGSRVYVSNWSQSVSVIDTATNTVVRNLPYIVTSIAVHPAGSFVYLASHQGADGIVWVLDGATLNLVARVSLGPTSAYPPDLAVHPAGTFVYALNFWEHTVSVIDTATHTVTATVPGGQLPYRIALQP